MPAYLVKATVFLDSEDTDERVKEDVRACLQEIGNRYHERAIEVSIVSVMPGFPQETGEEDD